MNPLDQVQLILCDMDETLLGPDKQVGPRSRAAIARLQAVGVTVALCTGRAPEAVRPVAQSLSIRYIICNNGATVHDGTELLHEVTMEQALTAEMLRFYDEREVAVYLMSPAGYFLTRRTASTDWADQYRKVVPPLIGPDAWAVPAHKVMPWQGSHLYEESLERFGGRAHVIYHPLYLEIAPKGISKQVGGERLAAHLGIAAERVAAMGDAQNDIEMVRWAGVGAAMGNADPLLKAVADLHLPSHDQDGAAELFEAILAARGA